ncbi:MAG: hypothetical protein LBU85_10385 [Treponema sp.]|jgi:hypothetical protein|nr:hypothetical protein [Treponema sp.]
MKTTSSVYDESPVYTFAKTLSVSSLRPAVIRCTASIFYNFFFRQYRAALLPGSVPVSRVDHPLDLKIPFVPSWVTIYLDFVMFWIRMLSFLLRTYGRRAYGAAREFIVSMGRLYSFAAETYRKNFSTTNRPFYIARPRFFVIHLLDPHLMCVPSLHVMVVIWTYTRFAAILKSFNDAGRYAAQIEEMKQGALAITHAILFVKQHSVNCIAAALYAMTRFAGEQFPPEEAEAFIKQLFREAPPPRPVLTGRPPANYRVRPWAAPRTRIPLEDASIIRAHITSLFRRFLEEGRTAREWEEPLLNFMRQMPLLRETSTPG